ncbi:TPA: hypothetical protein ACH3X1_014169 [Trebouxia sp. C0004]
MQQELTDKFLSVGEDRKTINRKLNELHTSTALDSARLQEFSELIDSKLNSHHKSLTRVVEESIDDFIAEVTNYIEERVPENADSTPAPATDALGLPFRFGPSIPSGMTRSFALAARTPPPADAIRMRSTSRTPAVPAINSDGNLNRKRAAFALSHGQSALCVLDNCGVEALPKNSHLLFAEDAVSDALASRIQEISASGDRSLHSLPADSPLSLGPVSSSH